MHDDDVGHAEIRRQGGEERAQGIDTARGGADADDSETRTVRFVVARHAPHFREENGARPLGLSRFDPDMARMPTASGTRYFDCGPLVTALARRKPREKGSNPESGGRGPRR